MESVMWVVLILAAIIFFVSGIWHIVSEGLGTADIVLVLLSFVAVILAVSVPAFGGSVLEFSDVVEGISKFGIGESWQAWDVRFTVFRFIPSVMMLLASLNGRKGLVGAFSLSGLLLCAFQSIKYYTYLENYFGADYMFDSASGLWCSLFLFLVIAIVAFAAKRASRDYR